MSSGFFAPFGDEITLSGPEDLVARLRLIDRPVPKRTEGRESHHLERWCIVRYLLCLSDASELRFPLTVRKDEHPDFFLERHCGGRIALEHTNAGTKKHQAATTELERRPEGTVLAGERTLVEPGDHSDDPGWVGDEPEREWASHVLSRIEEKTRKLNEAHFQSASRYDLLIYDMTHQPTTLADAGGYLQKLVVPWLKGARYRRMFSEVSVLRDQSLLFDVAGVCTVLPLRPVPRLPP